MKVKIDQSQKKYTQSQSLIDRMRGKPISTSTSFSVDLKVELTDEEKTIIKQYNLGEVIADEAPNTMLNTLAKEYEAGNRSEKLAREMKLYKEIGPLQFKLADFVAGKGFSRGFTTLREATDYVQKLKTDILPKIKNNIEHYSKTGGKASDTFEL
jgi:hypothetical protein